MDDKLIATLEKNQRAIARLNKEIEQTVGEQMTRLKTLEEQNEEMKAAILEGMEANDIDKFDGDLITITRTKAGVTNRFDSKRFKEERPKTYEKYIVTSPRKAYIKLKLKV